MEEEALAGTWGANKVFTSGTPDSDVEVGERIGVKQARHRLKELYNFHWVPPKCFVAQMAFTEYNGFLLTTDGRLFSWGKDGPCLGR